MVSARRAAWWLAAVITVLVIADPVGAQIYRFDLSGGTNPIDAITVVTRHLEDRKKALDEPLKVPETTDEIEAKLESVMTSLACILTTEDLAIDIRKAGHRRYPRGSKDREEFDKQLDGLNQAPGQLGGAHGPPREAHDMITALHKALGDPRERTVVLHELYHRANRKKTVEVIGFKMEIIYRPLDMWGTIECEGSTCPRR